MTKNIENTFKCGNRRIQISSFRMLLFRLLPFSSSFLRPSAASTKLWLFLLLERCLAKVFELSRGLTLQSHPCIQGKRQHLKVLRLLEVFHLLWHRLVQFHVLLFSQIDQHQLLLSSSQGRH